MREAGNQSPRAKIFSPSLKCVRYDQGLGEDLGLVYTLSLSDLDTPAPAPAIKEFFSAKDWPIVSDMVS